MARARIVFSATVQFVIAVAFLGTASAQAETAGDLDAVLAAQSEADKARYEYRHPKETLAFFGIEPGMTVVDTLPGTVWYAGILARYLGPDGRVIGADYPVEMWSLFGRFADAEFLAARADWTTTWKADLARELPPGHAAIDAMVYGAVPEQLHGVADAVLMIRAAHHLNRFEQEGGFFTTALQDVHTVLKPDGILGIVQHRAPETNSDRWAEGDNGYVKQSHMIAFVEAAGFRLVETSEINANPKDQPTNEDYVWRLPPSLRLQVEGEALEQQRAAMRAIGESDRMTLKFRKAE